MDEELVELILDCLPESLEGWTTLGILVCALAAAFWPRPQDSFWQRLHTFVCLIGRQIGRARKLARPSGKARQTEGKISLFRRKKE